MNFDKTKIAEYRAGLFRKEVETLAATLGMPADQQAAFCRYWTEHNPDDERLKADYSQPFDMEVRMQNWMEREKKTSKEKTQDQPLDKMQRMMLVGEQLFGKHKSTQYDEQ